MDVLFPICLLEEKQSRAHDVQCAAHGLRLRRATCKIKTGA